MTQTAQKQQDQQQISHIALKDITTEGQMVRREMDEDHVAELALSIAKDGLLQPIVVRSLGDGKYQLQAGAHRLAAVTRLRWQTVPAMVRDVDESTTKTTAVIENLQRRQLTIHEEIDAVEHMHHVDNKSINEIADALSKSRDWVTKRLGVRMLPDFLVDDVLDGVMPIAQAEAIAECKDENTQRMIANYVVQQRLSLRATRDMVAWYRDIPPQADGALPDPKDLPSAPPQTAPRRCDACGAPRGVEHLRVVWICADGCEEPHNE